MFSIELKGDEKIADLLIQNGANVNCFDKDKATPLHLASKKGNFYVLLQLNEPESNNSCT